MAWPATSLWRVALVVAATTARCLLGGADDVRMLSAQGKHPMAGRGWPPLPPPGARYEFSTARMPFVGAQRSTVTFLPRRRVRLDMRGAITLDGVDVAYSLDAATGRIVYDDLPRALREQLARLRTTLVSAEYSPDEDVVRVRVKPPVIPAMEMAHKRVAGSRPADRRPWTRRGD